MPGNRENTLMYHRLHMGDTQVVGGRGALVVNQMAMHRLARLGYSVQNKCYDIANAYGSVRHRTIAGQLHAQEPLPRHKTLLWDRLKKNYVVFGGTDGTIIATANAGTFQGDSIGGALFKSGFQQAIDRWSSDCKTVDRASILRFHCDLLNVDVDCSVLTYEDDINKTAIFAGIDHLVKQSKELDEKLSLAIGTIGLERNLAKQTTSVKAVGRGADFIHRSVYLKKAKELNGPSPTVRYLGPLINKDCRTRPGVLNRIRAMKVGWAVFASFFKSKATVGNKRMVFRSIIY